jgi:hypothetical protein
MMRDHHGWQVQFVDHDKRPFAYTVGLHNRGLPELLITGLNAQIANRVLKSLAHMIVDDGTVLAPAMHIDYEDRFLIEVIEVEHPDVHLKFAVEICGPGVRALQLVWADDRGRWPWDLAGGTVDADNRCSAFALRGRHRRNLQPIPRPRFPDSLTENGAASHQDSQITEAKRIGFKR